MGNKVHAKERRRKGGKFIMPGACPLLFFLSSRFLLPSLAPIDDFGFRGRARVGV
jgi:hypothetical protein